MELLVVIAIIGLLASLLLPAMFHAKALAQSAKCRSNARQLGIALALYVNDYDAYPLDGPDSSTDLPGRKWYLRLTPYAGANRGVWWCPMVRQRAGSLEGGYGYNAYGMTTFGSYGAGVMNFDLGMLGLGGSRRPDQVNVPLQSSRIRVPADMVAIGDAFEEVKGKVRISGNLWIGINFAAYDTDKEWTKTAARRHDSHVNAVFCDSHVEGARFDSIFAGHERAWRRWNNDNESHKEMRK